ncbi:MAG: hypothetical protein WBK95_07475, partial [Sulfurimonas sp.]
MPQNKIFSDSLVEQKYLQLVNNPSIKIVSFDIFDTLLLRKCTHPRDVFTLIGAHQEIIDFFDTPSAFSLYRQNAEKEARRVHKQKEDITLAEIYAQLPLPS